ncbi:MAG: hypothetical protein IPK82_38440 [Polyangiaceae bacterium]|nr:hypothetical protein [Polyangiaceae bacterium]
MPCRTYPSREVNNAGTGHPERRRVTAPWKSSPFYQCPLSAGSALTRLRRLRPQIAHLTFVRSLRGRQTLAIPGPPSPTMRFSNRRQWVENASAWVG